MGGRTPAGIPQLGVGGRVGIHLLRCRKLLHQHHVAGKHGWCVLVAPRVCPVRSRTVRLRQMVERGRASQSPSLQTTTQHASVDHPDHTALQTTCPAKHYCRRGDTSPSRCPPLVTCPVGTEVPADSYTGITVDVLLFFGLWITWQASKWYNR